MTAAELAKKERGFPVFWHRHTNTKGTFSKTPAKLLKARPKDKRVSIAVESPSGELAMHYVEPENLSPRGQ